MHFAPRSRYSEYMHICEAADEDSALEPEWSGVAGRVKVLLSEASSDIKAELRSDMAKAEDVAAMKLEMSAESLCQFECQCRQILSKGATYICRTFAKGISNLAARVNTWSET